MVDNFSTVGGDGDGSGSNVSDGAVGSGSNASDGERWGAADEALLACSPLTSCYVAWFLTGCRLVPVYHLGLWDPCCRESKDN